MIYVVNDDDYDNNKTLLKIYSGFANDNRRSLNNAFP